MWAVGGTFALYSLICRYAKIGTPNSGFMDTDSYLRRFSANSMLRRSSSRSSDKGNEMAVSALLGPTNGFMPLSVWQDESFDWHAIVVAVEA